MPGIVLGGFMDGIVLRQSCSGTTAHQRGGSSCRTTRYRRTSGALSAALKAHMTRHISRG